MSQRKWLLIYRKKSIAIVGEGGLGVSKEVGEGGGEEGELTRDQWWFRL